MEKVKHAHNVAVRAAQDAPVEQWATVYNNVFTAMMAMNPADGAEKQPNVLNKEKTNANNTRSSK